MSKNIFFPILLIVLIQTIICGEKSISFFLQFVSLHSEIIIYIILWVKGKSFHLKYINQKKMNFHQMKKFWI